MLLEITTTGKTVLLVVAGLFIAWAFVTAILIPRRNPGFPLNLTAYLALTAALFVAQMGAVYWVTTYQEVEVEAEAETGAAEETTPAETEPAETDSTESTPTETTPTETAPTESEPAGTTPAETEPAPEGGGNVAAGKRVFASAGCVSCHTLADAGSSGTVGPNLDEAKPSADKVVERVTNGKGVMPPFKDQLTEQQIADVAAYVSSVAGS